MPFAPARLFLAPPHLYVPTINHQAPILNGYSYDQKLTALTLQIEEDGKQWRETNHFPLCISYGAKATVQTDLPHAHALIWCTRGCVAASDLRNVASYDQDSMSLSALADVSETCALPAVAVVCMRHGAGRAAKKLLELGVEVVAWLRRSQRVRPQLFGREVWVVYERPARVGHLAVDAE